MTAIWRLRRSSSSRTARARRRRIASTVSPGRVLIQEIDDIVDQQDGPRWDRPSLDVEFAVRVPELLRAVLHLFLRSAVMEHRQALDVG